jgi:hypothetical protein
VLKGSHKLTRTCPLPGVHVLGPFRILHHRRQRKEHECNHAHLVGDLLIHRTAKVDLPRRANRWKHLGAHEQGRQLLHTHHAD